MKKFPKKLPCLHYTTSPKTDVPLTANVCFKNNKQIFLLKIPFFLFFSIFILYIFILFFFF